MSTSSWVRSAAILGLLLSPLPLQAQWEEQVTEQLNKAGEVAEKDGYSAIGRDQTGSLKEGVSQVIPVDLDAGMEYLVVGVCDEDCGDLDLRLRDPADREVDSDLETDATPVVSVTPSNGGAHRLEVVMVSCSVEPCFFGVRVFGRRQSGASGGGGESGSHVYDGELRDGDDTLQGGELVDRYPFHAQAGQTLVADLTSGAFDPYLILVDPRGNQIENDDFDGATDHSRIETEATETGEWRILVTSYESGETGAYRLTHTIRDGGAGPAPGTRSVRGSLSSADDTLKSGEYSDLYTLYGRRGDRVTLDLRSAEFDPYLILRIPGGDQEENDDHEGDPHRSLLSLVLTEDGEYSILVTSFEAGSTGSYDLSIQRNRAEEAAPSLRTEQGRLAEGDDTLRSGEFVDSYTFRANPGQRVHLELTSSEFDTYLILRLPNEEQVENDDQDDVGHSAIDQDITEPGEYQVLVTSFEAGETGLYELTMALESAQPSSTSSRDLVPISPGETARGSLEAGDSRLEEGEYRDIYVFEGEPGERIVLEMKSEEFDTYLALLDPGGDDTQNDDYEGDTSRSVIEMTLEEAGRYRIVATSYKAGETGSYELTLRRVASPSPSPPVTRAETGGEGRVFGVFAGIGDYGGRAEKLAYTAEDATRMRDALVRAAGMEPENGILLLDGNATVSNLRQAVREMAPRLGSNDTFVFFFSGHGGQVQRSQPQAADPDAMDETLEMYDSGLTDDQVRELLGEVNAGTVLVFLDACYSGGFSKDLISVPGRMGLFSSEEDVVSSVAAKFRSGGYLAAFLADGIGEGLADSDGDGSITTMELSQYVHDRYRTDVAGGDAEGPARAAGPQVGYQHLVVDRGSLGPTKVLFR